MREGHQGSFRRVHYDAAVLLQRLSLRPCTRGKGIIPIREDVRDVLESRSWHAAVYRLSADSFDDFLPNGPSGRSDIQCTACPGAPDRGTACPSKDC
jgi:hypothetical protein